MTKAEQKAYDHYMRVNDMMASLKQKPAKKKREPRPNIIINNTPATQQPYQQPQQSHVNPFSMQAKAELLKNLKIT